MKDTAQTKATEKEKRAEAEADLDEALEDSFPASDPLPSGGFTGAPVDHVSTETPETPDKTDGGKSGKA